MPAWVSTNAAISAVATVSVLTPRRPRRSAIAPRVKKPATIAIAIHSRCAAAASRSMPATSMNHGPAHSPCIDRNAAWFSVLIGTTRQNARLANTCPTPASASANPSPGAPRASSGRRGTTVNSTTAAVPDSAAKPANTPRQSVIPSSISTGAVADSAPRPPAVMMQPFANGSRSGANHSVLALNEAIRHADTPSPISARPTVSPGRPSLTANTALPAAATSSSADSTRRGP